MAKLLKCGWRRGKVDYINSEKGIGIIEDEQGELRIQLNDGKAIMAGALEPELIHVDRSHPLRLPHNGDEILYFLGHSPRQWYIGDTHRWAQQWIFVRDLVNAEKIISARRCYRVVFHRFGRNNKPEGEGTVVWKGTYLEDLQLRQLWDPSLSKVQVDYFNNFHGQLHFEQLEGEKWTVCPDPRCVPPIYRRKPERNPNHG
jgi:hypothetical protein